MAHPFASPNPVHAQPLQIAQVNHLPIVADFARRLGLVYIVNRLVPVQMEVEPGIVVLGMVLDTLSGRSPVSPGAGVLRCGSSRAPWAGPSSGLLQ
ncbi:DUF4277 domain-containing protein [Lamprobacter modestohalophilus]|uniref:DUF4277 domain-containing protein n=1 Tax=Lamprobacter modestohalophilus TaxID=1064514 RepID=UPI003D18D0A4